MKPFLYPFSISAYRSPFELSEKYVCLPKLDWVGRYLVSSQGELIALFNTNVYTALDIWESNKSFFKKFDLPVKAFDVLIDTYPRFYLSEEQEPHIHVIDAVCDESREVRWEYCRKYQETLNGCSLDLNLEIYTPETLKRYFSQGYKGVWFWLKEGGYLTQAYTPKKEAFLEMSPITFFVGTICSMPEISYDTFVWEIKEFFSGTQLKLTHKICPTNLEFDNWCKNLIGRNVRAWCPIPSHPDDSVSLAYFDGFIMELNFLNKFKSRVSYNV